MQRAYRRAGVSRTIGVVGLTFWFRRLAAERVLALVQFRGARDADPHCAAAFRDWSRSRVAASLLRGGRQAAQ
jgi:hypothetical protein